MPFVADTNTHRLFAAGIDAHLAEHGLAADWFVVEPGEDELAQSSLNALKALRATERVRLLGGLGEDAIQQCLDERIFDMPGARTLDLTCDPAGAVLQPKFRHAYEYSDCWVEDSRLVSLNARDAAQRGAVVLTRTRVTSAARVGDLWELVTEGPNGTQAHKARALVNAGGPWVEDVIRNVVRLNTTEGVRLVRGSHIVTRKIYDHDRCYFFQGTDGRIIFAIPYEQDFTLIGTTDQDHQGAPADAVCTDAERDYLLDFASRYFAKPVHPADVVWTFSGVRPLYDDGASKAQEATRDYVLKVDTSAGAPVLNSSLAGRRPSAMLPRISTSTPPTLTTSRTIRVARKLWTKSPNR